MNIIKHGSEEARKNAITHFTIKKGASTTQNNNTGTGTVAVEIGRASCRERV